MPPENNCPPHVCIFFVFACLYFPPHIMSQQNNTPPQTPPKKRGRPSKKTTPTTPTSPTIPTIPTPSTTTTPTAPIPQPSVTQDPTVAPVPVNPAPAVPTTSTHPNPIIAQLQDLLAGGVAAGNVAVQQIADHIKQLANNNNANPVPTTLAPPPPPATTNEPKKRLVWDSHTEVAFLTHLFKKGKAQWQYILKALHGAHLLTEVPLEKAATTLRSKYHDLSKNETKSRFLKPFERPEFKLPKGKKLSDEEKVRKEADHAAHWQREEELWNEGRALIRKIEDKENRRGTDDSDDDEESIRDDLIAKGEARYYAILSFFYVNKQIISNNMHTIILFQAFINFTYPAGKQRERRSYPLLRRMLKKSGTIEKLLLTT